MSLPCHYHAIALTCRYPPCHASAMPLPCHDHAITPLPCIPLPCHWLRYHVTGSAGSATMSLAPLPCPWLRNH
eukprot:9699950-Karenia_brevis.AAC.1